MDEATARIDVGGRSLVARCRGDGSSAVLFEAGFGSTSLDWWNVQARLALRARTCSYDRAGLGASDPPDGAATPATARRDTKAVVDALDLGPVLLVGYSFGAPLALLYAMNHPNDVAGLVLLDGTAEVEAANRWSSRAVQRATAPLLFRIRRREARHFLRRGTPPARVPFGMGALHWFPEEARPLLAEVHASRRHLTGARREWSLLASVLMELRARGGRGVLGDVPLVSVSSGATARAWRSLPENPHARWATFSSRGQHLTLDGTTHFFGITQPDLVCEVIEGVMDQP